MLSSSQVEERNKERKGSKDILKLTALLIKTHEQGLTFL